MGKTKCFLGSKQRVRKGDIIVDYKANLIRDTELRQKKEGGSGHRKKFVPRKSREKRKQTFKKMRSLCPQDYVADPVWRRGGDGKKADG